MAQNLIVLPDLVLKEPVVIHDEAGFFGGRLDLGMIEDARFGLLWLQLVDLHVESAGLVLGIVGSVSCVRIPLLHF